MNIVFIVGEIIEKIEFDFIVNNDYDAVSRTMIRTFKGFNKKGEIKECDLKVHAFNEMADELVSKYNIGDNIAIRGYLKSNYIVIEKIY